MIVETELINYGLLGMWTAMLIYEKYNQLAKFKLTMEKNTVELHNLSANIEHLVQMHLKR